jgi:p-hydroxybenzoate 3-monooxygenase
MRVMGPSDVGDVTIRGRGATGQEPDSSWTAAQHLGYPSGMERRAVDVCVVGAGPAGLVVAHRLLAAGVSCLVLERLSDDALCARAKAGMIEHRVVRALDAVGLAEPILQRGTTNGVVEICVEGQRHVFDYAALTGGHGHHVYPQHLLVRAWADQLLARGGRVLFATEALAIEPDVSSGGTGATVLAQADGKALAIECGAVLLATGAGGRLLPDGIVSHEHWYPFRWLTTMLEQPPLGERTIYAPHSRGFAAHLRRSTNATRYYLQIPSTDGLVDWSDERITSELCARLGVPLGTLSPHAIVERDVMDLRVRVREPLQRGPVFLAGDAAHLITPAGGKGMNLAIHDALELSEGLIERFGSDTRGSSGGSERLSRYSQTRLPRIWEAQEFSSWMLSLFSGGLLNVSRAMPDPAACFAARLHRAQIERLFTEPGFARWFAHRYAGVDAGDAGVDASA